MVPGEIRSEIQIFFDHQPQGRVGLRWVDGGEEGHEVLPLPDRDVLTDLLTQARAGAPAAARALGELLGAVLFGGQAGARVRASLSHVVALRGDDELLLWPWELALDPETGRCPVVEGLELVRVSGPVVAARRRGVPRAMLVVPRIAGPTRLEAVTAVTRPLARKARLEVFPADPVTGPALRRQLAHGAALVHLEGLEGEVVALDDGAVPTDRLGLDGLTWLLVLAGSEASAGATLSIRRQGVQVVVGRQVALEPHTAAVADRDFYRTLASGGDPLEATRRARQALVAACGVESFRWAAPLVWSSPAVAGQSLPAQVPFPPILSEVEDEPVEEPLSIRRRVSVVTSVANGPAVPAPVFVRETVRMLQAGVDPLDLEVDSRLAALRQLGTGLEPGQTPPPDLGPEERTSWLADRLVDGIGRSDEPLVLPADLDARVRRSAAAAGQPEATVRALAQALLSARAVAVVGDGGRALAEAVAASVFSFQITHVHAGDPALIGGPSGTNPHEGDGWLYRTLALNWRRDELDPRRVFEPRPRTRMRLLSRTAEGWNIHLGTWLVLTEVERADPCTLARLLAAVEDGCLAGFERSGQAFRLAVPQDFRVLLVGRSEELPAWVPIFQVPRAPSAARIGRWLLRLEERLGPAAGADETEARAALAEAVEQALRLSPEHLAQAALGEAMLTFAVQHGGPNALDEALGLFLAPRLDGDSRRRLTHLQKELRHPFPIPLFTELVKKG